MAFPQLPLAARRSMFAIFRASFGDRAGSPLVSALRQQARLVSSNPQAKGKGKTKATTKKKDRKGRKEYEQADLKDVPKFSLCDAMRYLRAAEAGQQASAMKYEVHIRLRSVKDGPVIRNMLRFPHPVQTESRICVVCPPGSKHDKEARAAGAVLVGEQQVFDAVKQGRIEFDRLICHPDSLDALNKAALGRILGPRGLMPSVKTSTVVEDVAARVEMLRGGTIYRERDAVVRLAVGQLAFSPDQLRANLRTVVDQIKKDAASLSDRVKKEIYEVVLSSTHGPAMTLSGDFRSDSSPPPEALTGP